MNQTFMKERKVLPLVLSMSLPMVISMAVNSLYNIVAKLSEKAMTALALVYPVQNLINAIAIGFGIGINASSAFYLGVEDRERADQAASCGLFLNFIHGAALTVLSIAAMPLFLRAFSRDKQIIDMALAYADRAFAFSVVIMLGISFERKYFSPWGT